MYTCRLALVLLQYIAVYSKEFYVAIINIKCMVEVDFRMGTYTNLIVNHMFNYVQVSL